MTDRVQVPPRARGDVHEPHGSSRVRGARHDVADDAHGTDIQIAQCPIPCRHLGEVVAQPRRATALLPGVRPRSDLDSQSRSVSHGQKCSVERRIPRRGRVRWLDDKKPSNSATTPAICEQCTAPGFLDTRLRYAAWRSSYCSRASSGVRYASFSRRQHWL